MEQELTKCEKEFKSDVKKCEKIEDKSKSKKDQQKALQCHEKASSDHDKCTDFEALKNKAKGKTQKALIGKLEKELDKCGSRHRSCLDKCEKLKGKKFDAATDKCVKSFTACNEKVEKKYEKKIK